MQINWLKLVQLSLPDDVAITEYEIIILRQPDYFEKLEKLLTSKEYNMR